MNWTVVRLACAVLLLALPLRAMAGDRVALIIANSEYKDTPGFQRLPTPDTDATLVTEALIKAGFDKADITVVHDARLGEIKRAIQAFGDRAEGKEVALFYYAGHGIEIKDKNYLIPVGAQIHAERDVDLEAVSLDAVRDEMALARLKLVVLDACRENPFTRGAGGGLAALDAAAGEAVLYSTGPKKPALDANGRYSPFARAFSKEIIVPGNEIDMVFRRIHDDVKLETDSRQEPFHNTNLSGSPFYFITVNVTMQPPSEPMRPMPAFNPAEIETALWQGALLANSAAGFEDYLSRYPNGTFAVQARAILARMKPAPSPAPVPVAMAKPPAAAKPAPVALSVPVPETVADGGMVITTLPVSTALWRVCVTDGGCTDIDDLPEAPDFPVIKVSWDAANGFAQWLSARTGRTWRLPTVDELRRAYAAAPPDPAAPAKRLPSLGTNPAAPGTIGYVGKVIEWTATCAQAGSDCSAHVVIGKTWDDAAARRDQRDEYPDRAVGGALGFRLVEQR